MEHSRPERIKGICWQPESTANGFQEMIKAGDGDQKSNGGNTLEGKDTEEQGPTKGAKSLKTHAPEQASDESIILPPLRKTGLQCRLRVRK